VPLTHFELLVEEEAEDGIKDAQHLLLQKQTSDITFKLHTRFFFVDSTV